MYVHATSVSLMPAEIRRWSESLKLELGMVVSHHVGSGASARGAIALNHWAFLQARNINLTIYVYEFLPDYKCTVMHPGGGIKFMNWGYKWCEPPNGNQTWVLCKKTVKLSLQLQEIVILTTTKCFLNHSSPPLEALYGIIFSFSIIILHSLCLKQSKTKWQYQHSSQLQAGSKCPGLKDNSRLSKPPR